MEQEVLWSVPLGRAEYCKEESDGGLLKESDGGGQSGCKKDQRRRKTPSFAVSEGSLPGLANTCFGSVSLTH